MKNWKTTLAGWIGGAANVYAGGVSFKNVLLSVAIAVLGSLAKDGDVTGGTRPQ